jgi:DNA helicase-2/ATP-dependent DNA helicase PcrA
MFSARELAALMGPEVPTAEQELIIEGEPGGTFRIVAGAGSGKTETMAQRVVWLIANSHVTPSGVLGLTFTKKAARELHRRIRSHLTTLVEAGVGVVVDEFEGPTVSTYNAFAAGLYRDHAILLGRDPDATVLSEASAWALTRRVVVSSTHPGLEQCGLDPRAVTNAVRRLSQRLAENPVPAEDLEKFVTDLLQVKDLPPGGRGTYPDVGKALDKVALLPMLASLVAEVAHAKRLRGVLEFSDQIAFGVEMIHRFPEIAAQLRDRYGAVLLDEYQDTSVAQTTLLSNIFGGHPVMAVGDPHQAIYAWRGASSANLVDFDHVFGPHVTAATLSTSWRNGTVVLDAANHIAGPLRELPGPRAGILTPRDGADSLRPEIRFPATLREEADQVAQWCAEHLANPTASSPPSAAVILRARAHQKVFVDALMARDVPVHVLGIGGLLEDPAIADVVCVLRILAHPHAETELVRLLTGGRWRLGAADIHALAATARWLIARDEKGNEREETVAKRVKASLAAGDHAGLLDALFFIATAPPSHHQRQQYSETGLARLADAYRVIAALQSQRFGDVAELVVVIEQELGLDIELLAHPQRASSRAARNAFMEALSGYLAFADEAGVAGFVQWLEEAERKDNLSPRPEEPQPGCVQVLTIHGAKGLEWDLVALPRLVEGELPGTPKGTSGWLFEGELPYEFRGDVASLPVFAWRSADTVKEVEEARKAFKEDMTDHQIAEERRLMYVAITRAKRHLLISGSYWAHQKTVREPSRFVLELIAAGVLPALPENPFPDEPPSSTVAEAALWPRDPLGSRRTVVDQAAALVTEALARTGEDILASSNALREVREEMVASLSLAKSITLPVRIPASSLEGLMKDPLALRETLARPVPGKPYRAALRGTLFHRFVEDHFDASLPGPRLDLDAADTDEGDELSITQWQEAFLSSEFPLSTPIAVEAELHLPMAGHLIICKIDAVFETPDGVHIVDWKTGKLPDTPEEWAAKSWQLAAYRLAWSQWSGSPVDAIRASFWYAEGSHLVTPENLPDAPEFEARFVAALAV